MLGASTEKAKDLCMEHSNKDREKQKKDTEVRLLIKEEKDRYRDLSTKIRVDGRHERKVFEKFVNVHDEKLVLRKHALHAENSPKNRIKASGAIGTVSGIGLLTPQVIDSYNSPLKSQRQRIHNKLGRKAVSRAHINHLSHRSVETLGQSLGKALSNESPLKRSNSKLKFQNFASMAEQSNNAADPDIAALQVEISRIQ